MGTYFNPNNESFKKDSGSRIYVDKTKLLKELNEVVNTNQNCISLSHARRFGKSQVAGMIDAYYSLGSDSRELFEPLEISKDPDFEKHLNKYNVIHLDIASFTDDFKEDLVDKLKEYMYEDFQKVYPDIDYKKKINKILMEIFEISGRPFIVIIDEWDCVVRNFSDDQGLVHEYLQFLHSIFKSEESKTFLALGYITGILPIKKIKNESALNNFREYTMVSSKNLTQYFGFTEDEVKVLCEKYDMNFSSVKEWYDGYLIDGLHIYNPNSVYQSMVDHSLESYWKNTSSFETINSLISIDKEGLRGDILSMLKGEKITVDVTTFQNDISTISSKDDALTALIHLGYLGYDRETGTSYIPNFEVSQAYSAAIKTGDWDKVAESIRKCDELLLATIRKDEEKVAELLELSHDTYTSKLRYNDENALSCAITMAYFTAPAYYNVIRELPSGKGFADIAMIPRADSGNKPAIIIELKWDQTADTAIKQIKERRYEGELRNYKKEIILVGISYKKKSRTKKHQCKIESVKI